MATQSSSRKLCLADPHAELPIKNHKYVKNCTELYMANKRIDKIANFDAFVNLEVLWINGNQIQQLDGLDKCIRLKQLYAQNNCIRSLDDSSLLHFKFLQELRLYDNKLKDLHGVLEMLSRLSHLRDLDLFGNAVVEEENYRLQVIRAIPSLDVLDRHVITEEERLKASRLQLHDDVGIHGAHSNQHNQQKSKNKTFTVAGAPPQALSGTVKMLFKEVAAIKREQQKQNHDAAAREQQELTRTQQLALSSTFISKRTSNNNKADNIQSLSDWEFAALKKYFQTLEGAKNGGIMQDSLERVCQYLRKRGYTILCDGFRLDVKAISSLELQKLIPVSGTIVWKEFVQLFETKRLQCELLCPQDLCRQAAECFDKCAVMQRRLQALDSNDSKSAQLVKESLELSQQGYHLQALADGDNSSSTSRSSRIPSSKDVRGTWDTAPISTPRTKFYMTAFTREKVPAPPSVAASRDCSSKFSELKDESANLSEALAGKYRIRQKDFTKYLLKQSAQTTKLVRRNYQL